VKKALLTLLSVIALAFASLLFMLFLWPRPVDTTEARVFDGDASKLDHCALPVLDGSGLSAKQIPKAYTPGCGWTEFPMPILANCTEPLAEGTVDMRGLWLAHTGKVGHVERMEQCGDRVVVTSAGIIHDFHTDGTLANGSRDIEPPLCINTFVSIDYDGDVMTFHPFGLPTTVVKRWMEADELVWTYPAIEGEVRMKRICELPEEARGGVQLHP
jgi:hypothetical protein